MNSLICPISTLRLNHNVVRITGLMMASMIALYASTDLIYFMILIAIDYFIRAFTPLPYSPFSWLARQISQAFHLSEKQIDKAPKIFAARVGFLFALTSSVLFVVHPGASLIVALVLMSFALLESVFDICMGCLVYHYIVFPIFGKE
jgi:hypothetical protein